MHKPGKPKDYMRECLYCKQKLDAEIYQCRGCRESGVILTCASCFKAWVWDDITKLWIELVEVTPDD